MPSTAWVINLDLHSVTLPAHPPVLYPSTRITLGSLGSTAQRRVAAGEGGERWGWGGGQREIGIAVPVVFAGHHEVNRHQTTDPPTFEKHPSAKHCIRQHN